MGLRYRAPVGVEALTRFTDGSAPTCGSPRRRSTSSGSNSRQRPWRPPSRRVAGLPADAFLALNVSPDLVLEGGRLARLLGTTDRPVVLELTEHAPIDDYAALRAALAGAAARPARRGR